ncbi:helix-turn-helix domain-containing protein [Paracoccaceae bacterium GXU_MW_L88]
MQRKIDKRDRAALFRARLVEAMERQGESRSGLARAAEVDRSTIGQLLTEGETRLPGGQLLADLAAHLHVSSDWLLGLTERPERPGDLLAAAMTVTGAGRSPADEQIIAWHREAEGYKIRHVPATLPDMLKTPDVLGWEYETFMGRTPEQAKAAAQDKVDWLADTRSDYEIALPVHELTAFAEGSGYYKGLPRHVRRSQLDHMTRRCADQFPALRLFLFDARKVFSAPVTVFGPILAVIYVGRFYLAFRDGERLRSITTHFDWLVREAEIDARDAAAFIAELRDRDNLKGPLG